MADPFGFQPCAIARMVFSCFFDFDGMSYFATRFVALTLTPFAIFVGGESVLSFSLPDGFAFFFTRPTPYKASIRVIRSCLNAATLAIRFVPRGRDKSSSCWQ